MADGQQVSASMAKLARLKKLKQGLGEATAIPAEERIETSEVVETQVSQPEPTIAEEIAQIETSAPAASAQASDDKNDPESLSAYFEALGFEPDPSFSPLDGAQDAPDETTDVVADVVDSEPDIEIPADLEIASAPDAEAELGADPVAETVEDPAAVLDAFDTVDEIEEPADGPTEDFVEFAEAREVNATDLWNDPVRTDDVLDTFARDAAGVEPDFCVVPPESVEADPSFAAEEQSALAMDNVDIGDDALPTFPDSLSESTDFEAQAAAFAETSEEPNDPVFEAVAAEAEAEAATASGLVVTLDEGRAKMLDHVAKQMNCSADDVVITALDWYMDALFGEDSDTQETA